jgi:transcriptional regulator with XRE-family HTH domain
VKTRIRHHRRLRRLTQLDLARLVGTTAATISRLETADMNVSMNWLQRFASVFNVPVSDLVAEPRSAQHIRCVGAVDRAGALLSDDGGDDDDVSLDALARHPIAIRIRENVGSYRAGDIVIADKLASDDVQEALGRDCLVAIDDETGRFGRFVASGPDAYLLVPPEPGAEVRNLTLPGWVAPVVMLIRYL